MNVNVGLRAVQCGSMDVVEQNLKVTKTSAWASVSLSLVLFELKH
jgi:hypothetical protein